MFTSWTPQTVDIHCVIQTDCRAKIANIITTIGSTCAPSTWLELWIDYTIRLISLT